MIFLIIWIAVNTGDEPCIEAFQQYDFKEYINYFFNFAIAVYLPLAIVLLAITGMLHIGIDEVKGDKKIE